MNFTDIMKMKPGSMRHNIPPWNNSQSFIPTACLSTGNGSVKFVSKNFYNVLHWDPVEPAVPGEKVLYTVWYWR